MTTDLTPGTPVRFLTTLGLIANPEARGFLPEVVVEGDTGAYDGPHPDAALAAQDWHLVRVPQEKIPVHSVHHEGDVYAPVHRSHFEVIPNA